MVRSSMTSFACFHKASTRSWAAFLLFVYSRTFLILACSVFSARTFATISLVKGRSSTILTTAFTLSIRWPRFFLRNSWLSGVYKEEKEVKRQKRLEIRQKRSSYRSCSYCGFWFQLMEALNAASGSGVTCSFRSTSLRGVAVLFLIFES